MAGRLADRDAQDVLCVEQASGSASNQTAQGSWALSVKVIPFPADDLKRQQRRLAGNIGKSQPDFGPADKALGSPPSDGCHKQ
jgi:hypothetical protein